MSEEEFEVERILRAKLTQQRGSRRRLWKYYVKWKGYDEESDNTWEPAESFTEGSQHFIESFWERIGDSRDYKNTSLFRLEEEIFPKGFPKKFKKRAPKPTTNEDDKKSETSLEKKGDSEKEVTTLIDDDSYTHRKRRNSTPPETPPSKRMRPSVAQQASILKGVEGNDVSPNATAGHLPLQAASRLAHDTSGPLSTRKTRRAPVPTDPPVNIVSDSEKSEVELQVSPKVENKSPHTPQGDLNPQPSTSKLSPRPKIVPRVLNEDPDTPLLPSVSAASSTAPPKFGPPRGLKPKSTMPAHRVRAANTRVKMIDQPLTEQSRPINVKARLLAHMKDESGETVQATQPEIPRPGWGKKFKPGPGRSSAGLQAAYLGSRSSPPSTNDGPSKVPRKSKRIDKAKAPQQSVPEEYDQSTVVAPPGETHDQDIVMQDGEARGDDQPIEASHPISPLTNEQPSTASDVRTSDIRASSLEGKVVELPAPRIEVTTEGSSYQVQPATRISLKDILKSPVTSSSIRAFGSTWGQSTIFGSLALGRGDHTMPPQKTASESVVAHLNPTILLVLDSTLCIPIVLKDVSPAVSENLKPLNNVLIGASRGPPGKFFKDELALELISALRIGGSCARVDFEESGGELQAHFQRFRTRLRAGELFAVMVGDHLLAFCASENSALGPKLGMSPNLLGLAGDVLVAEVVIENEAAYCDAVMKADTERW